MPHPAQSSHRTSNAEEDGCLRLIEALAQGDPVPDTSAICLERKELFTFLAEISKGERSEFLQQITQVAQRRGISLEEIATRAGFLLACLDSGGDDYYAILGVPPTATSQEIRDAWIDRVSIYHPDRHPAKADWFNQQVARLNEAYQTLKDPGRRQTYDEERREGLERQRRDSTALRRAPGRPKMSVFVAARLRHRLPALITGGSVIAAGLIVFSLFLSRASNRPEATPFLPSNTPWPAAEALSRGESGSHASQGSQSEGPELESQRTPKRASRARARPVPRDTKRAYETSGEAIVLAQPLPPLAPEPKGLERQEIDALLDEYVEAYEKGDVERLVATLSPRVRERGTLDYQAIRSLYAKGFAGREQIIYRIKNVQTEIKGDVATVAAQYLISARNASQSQKSVTVSGTIEWKIVREGDKPKIVAINY